MESLLYGCEILLLLAGILGACLFFSNAIEHLGEELNLGDQVTGSILAAVGTALPETIIPLVAILVAVRGESTEVNGSIAAHDIAVGAIIGAPFMLSTLALFVMGATILIFKKKRGTTTLQINIKHLRRDLFYFLGAFSLLVLSAGFSPSLKIFTAVALAFTYAFYVFQTIKAGKEGQEVEEVDLPELYFQKFLKLPTNITVIIVQTIVGLLGIIYFAEKFVHTLETVAFVWGISPLVLSLIITPIATELPEKINSCIWSSQSKDTLAMGNITGAMVFQSTIPGIIGVLFTPWQFEGITYTCAIIAIVSTAALLIPSYTHQKIKAEIMMLAGLLYLIYIYVAFFA